MKRIRIEVKIPGQGSRVFEFEHCPISQHGDAQVCPLGGGVCKFGLTEITPPEICPIKRGREITMNFTLVDV